MFEECSVMIIKAGVGSEEIYRVDVDINTQKEICQCFSKATKDLISEKSDVIFNGSYKPHDDEILTIQKFQLSDKIMDAIRDPLGVPTYQKCDEKFPEIKAIFVGERIQTGDSEKFNVAFQRFRREQYISTKWYNLFFDNDTFFQEKRFGISISDIIDCYYKDGNLQFSSFYFAKQIFDLSDYYRSATDKEVDAFVVSDKLLLDNGEQFKVMANTWIRRKIAMINDSKVLEIYPAQEIKKIAIDAGVDIEIENNKIKIPDDKEKIKLILGFLDEEAYKGPFSQNVYLANSKRQVK